MCRGGAGLLLVGRPGNELLHAGRSGGGGRIRAGGAGLQMGGRATTAWWLSPRFVPMPAHPDSEVVRRMDLPAPHPAQADAYNVPVVADVISGFESYMRNGELRAVRCQAQQTIGMQAGAAGWGARLRPAQGRQARAAASRELQCQALSYAKACCSYAPCNPTVPLQLNLAPRRCLQVAPLLLYCIACPLTD